MSNILWNPLPYPFWEVATPRQVSLLEFPTILERLIEDAAGQAGVLAVAAQDDEADDVDVQFAARVLSEHLHATVKLWREWRKRVAPDEAD